jgi:glycosyltransferase involved in cell wall biosynthesis
LSPEQDGGTRPEGFLSRRDRALILYVIQLPDYSGGELMHVPLMQADAEPLLACPPGSRTEELAHGLGIPTTPLPFRPLRHSQGLLDTLRSVARGLRSALDLRRTLQRHPERRIVYCTAARPGMLAAVAGIGLRRRRLWVLCDLMPPPPLRGVLRLLARFGAEAVIAQSRAVERDFVRGSKRLARRTQVIGLPGARADNPLAASARPGIPTAAIVGPITDVKRTELAVEIAGLVGREAPEFRLLVVGRPQFRASDFAYAERLRERVEADPALRRHVTFAGWTDDVRGRLAECGLLLHCRPDEPYGLALLEAMEVGLPVVAPAAYGPTEIVEDGVTGLLYEPGSAQAAARQVLRILRDPDLARRLGAASLEAVRGRLRSDRQIARAEDVLAGLV